jgi:hypothetical protein
MKLKKNDIELIAHGLYRDLQGKEFVEILLHQKDFFSCVTRAIEKNMEEEKNLEDAVRKMLEPYEAQFRSGELDYHKMFELTKKQLAHKKGIVL